MKTIIALIISIFSTSVLIDGNQKLNFESQVKITFISLLDEKTYEYICDGDKIKVSIIHGNSKIARSSKQLSNDSISKFHIILNEVFEKLPQDTVYSNPAILDGFIWDTEIVKNSNKKHFQVINEKHEDLDKLIFFLNNNLNTKNRTIYPTYLLY